MKLFRYIKCQWDWSDPISRITQDCGRTTVSSMEPAESEMSIIPNGKGHDLAEDMCVPVKTMLEEEQ